MLEWIAKYWLEVLFTLICGGVAFIVRHHVKLIVDNQKRHEKEMVEAMEKKFDQ